MTIFGTKPEPERGGDVPLSAGDDTLAVVLQFGVETLSNLEEPIEVTILRCVWVTCGGVESGSSRRGRWAFRRLVISSLMLVSCSR